MLELVFVIVAIIVFMFVLDTFLLFQSFVMRCELNIDIFYRIFADEIVIKLDAKSVPIFLRIYGKLCDKFNFILGIKKCKILCDRNHK